MSDAVKPELSHAEQNAVGWLESIREYMAALNADRERLEELREARDDYDPDNAEELATLEAAVKLDGEEVSAEQARERIEESPLSVQVRSGWYQPGAEREPPEEYEILLTTGGPALRIVGDLDANGTPTSARLQYQDWGTPWTEHFAGPDHDDLLAYAQCFYFGEGQ